jgi:hypothetical protein
MRRETAGPLVAQRLRDQQRPEVRAADADVHDLPQRLAGRAALAAVAHRRDERLDPLAGRQHLVLDRDGPGERRAQRRVQHRASLGHVDRIAAEHRLDPRREPDRPRERAQRRERVARDPLARQVEQPVGVLDVQALEPTPVGVDQIAQVRRAHRRGLCDELAPLGQRRMQCGHR